MKTFLLPLAFAYLPASVFGAAIPAFEALESTALISIGDEDTDPFEIESLGQKVKAIGRLSTKNEQLFWDDLRESLRTAGAPQVGLVEALLADSTIEPFELPLISDFSAHDAKTYPPGSTRKKVRAGSGTWKKLDKEMVLIDAARDLPTHYLYDFGTGEIVMLDKAVKKIKRCKLALDYALRGFPLDQDLAEAILLSRLDEQRKFGKEDHFFAHDYADLKSKAYDGISLYRVWSHQIPLDVPNVDLRAYAKLIHNEELPVKVSQKVKDAWYPRMSSSLFDSRGHRQAALGTAAHYFQAAPKVPGGWVASSNVLHAFYAHLDLDAKSGTGPLIAAFHDKGAGIAASALPTIQEGGNEAWNKGNARKDEILKGRMKIREAAIAAMDRALDK